LQLNPTIHAVQAPLAVYFIDRSRRIVEANCTSPRFVPPSNVQITLDEQLAWVFGRDAGFVLDQLSVPWTKMISTGEAAAWRTNTSHGKLEFTILQLPKGTAAYALQIGNCEEGVSSNDPDEVVREAVLLERGRIAAELHDGIAPQLAGAKLKLDALAINLKQTGVANDIEAVADILADAMTDLRGINLGLKPKALLGGLRGAVESFCTNYELVTLTISGNVALIPNDQQVALYRVLQEGVHNALQHAAHSAVSVHLTQADGRATLIIEDNGPGLERQIAVGADASGGYGLGNIRDRVESAGGSFELRSSSAGTSLIVSLPV